MYARTMLSKSGSDFIPTAGPSLGSKFDAHVATIRFIAGSSTHLTRSATASPATTRSALTISFTPTQMPGTLIDRVCANAVDGASCPTMKLSITVRGDCTHIWVVGETG